MSIGRGPWRGPPKTRPCSASIALQTSSSSSGLQGGPHPDGGVQEVGLIEDLPDRLGLIERGHRIHGDRMRRQVLDRPAEVGFPVADVGAQAEVAQHFRGQTPSSSSDSRSRERSSVTSTPASCTW